MCIKLEPLLMSFYTVLISVIPNPDKGPSDCSSYRPISLINVDLKIYSREFACGLESVLQDLIHLDQTGFIKGHMAALGD